MQRLILVTVAGVLAGGAIGATHEPAPPPVSAHERVVTQVRAADILAVQNRDQEAVDAYRAALGDTADAEYVMRRLNDLSHSTSDYGRVCDAVGRVPFSDPYVEALAVRLRADMLWTMGRTREAVALIATLAPLTNWYLCGGFGNDERTGLPKEYGPESDPGLARDYEGKEWRVAWRPAVPLTRFGAVDLGLVRPARWLTVYLRSGLVAPVATQAMLHLDFEGSFRVWLNGRPAAEASKYIDRTAEMYRVPLDLCAGTNFLLVKLCAENNGARFFARLATIEGAPVRLASVQPPDNAVPLLSGQTNQWPEPKMSPHNEDLRVRWAKTKDPDTGLELARQYTATRRCEDAARVFERVKNDRALNPADLFAMADAYARKDSQSEAIALFRSALAADTNANAARVAIAAHYMDRTMYELAQPLLQEAVGINSNDLSARMALANLYERRGWNEDAFQLAEETARMFGSYTEAHLALGSIALSLSHAEYAETEARRALACSPVSLGAHWQLISQYEDQRAFDKLDAELAILEQLDPTEMTPAMKRVDRAYAQRDPARGIAVCTRALEQFPDYQTFHRRLGDFLRMQHDKAGAIKAYQQSLVYQPDDLHLRRYLDFLKGKSHAFFVNNTLDDAAVRTLVNAARRTSIAGDEAITETILQQDLVQLYEDGSSRHQQHTLVRVLKPRGVQEASSMRVPSSDVTRAVTHKMDGRVIEASHVNGGQIEFADVEIGDVIECRYLDDRYGGSWLEDNYYAVEVFEREQSLVRRAEFVLAVPTNRSLVSMVSSATITSDISRMQGSMVYRWCATNVPMFKSEPSSPPYLDIGTFVAVSTITNWDMIAQWQYAMMSDVSRGDISVRHLAETIAHGATTDAERVSRVFRYVTKNFRYTQMYVSRIAGVKPHPVPNIMANRCGDCKDLSLLTAELLKSLGMKAQLALIRTRSLGVLITNVPAPDVFNHVVVYLPTMGANGWFVDPTFRNGEADLLPPVCQDVCALVISGATHQFVHTPVAPPSDSVTEFILHGCLNADGSLTGGLDFVSWRLDAANIRTALERIDSFDKIGQYILAKIDPAGRVKKFAIENNEPTNAPVVMRLAFVAPTFAKNADGRLSAKLPMPFDAQDMLGGLEQRTHPVRLMNLRCERRDYSIALPHGRVWDMAVTNLHRASQFGTFDFDASGDEQSVRIAWSLVLSLQQITTNEYAGFRDFMAEVADTTTQVLTVHRAK